MFDWLKLSKDEEVAFEQKYIEPVKRQKRDDHIAVQLSIPPAIEAIRAQLKALEPKEETAKSRRIQLERKLADIQSDLKAAKEEEQSLHWEAADLRSQIETLKARQAQFGSALLTEFILEMTREWEKLRNAGADEFREGKKNLLTGKTKATIWTNRPAIEKAIAYCRAAMVEAEALRSMPLTDAEVSARLDALRKGIPAVGEWTKVDVKQALFVDNPPPRYGGEIRLPAEY